MRFLWSFSHLILKYLQTMLCTFGLIQTSYSSCPFCLDAKRTKKIKSQICCPPTFRATPAFGSGRRSGMALSLHPGVDWPSGGGTNFSSSFWISNLILSLVWQGFVRTKFSCGPKAQPCGCGAIQKLITLNV